MSNFNLGLIGKFQMGPFPVNESDWMQYSVRLGGKQSGSNYNARFEYIYVRRKSIHDLPIGTGVGHILAPQHTVLQLTEHCRIDGIVIIRGDIVSLV